MPAVRGTLQEVFAAEHMLIVVSNLLLTRWEPLPSPSFPGKVDGCDAHLIAAQ